MPRVSINGIAFVLGLSIGVALDSFASPLFTDLDG